MKPPVLLYCHCQYAQVLPEEVKKATLKKLSDSGQPFEAVPDLCELAARRDPALARIAAAGPVKIAACFSRAGKCFFHPTGAPPPTAQAQIENMRPQPAEEAGNAMLEPGLTANLPAGKITQAD